MLTLPSHLRCLVDGRSDDTSSTFITPRPREDMLRFRIDVFRFAGDTRNLVWLCVRPPASPKPSWCSPPVGPHLFPLPSPQIYITCHLKVTPVDQTPDPLNKACSFNKARNT